MLEGLEISELDLSKVLASSYSARIDSNFFQKEFLISDIKGNSITLDKICHIRSGTTPSERSEELKQGVVLLKTEKIRNRVLQFFNPDEYFYIDFETNQTMRNTELRQGDVLINIVGATTEVIGRCAYLPDTFPKANITQAMALLRIKDEYKTLISPHFLFSFLISYYGKKQTRRIARPTGQYNMNLSETGSFEIPIFSAIYQAKISELIVKSQELSDRSIQCYSKAEQVLLNAVGLADFQPSEQNTNIKTFAESFGASGRLDAEYYQLKYEVFETTVKSNKNGYTQIKNEYDHFNAVSRKPKAAYHYIEISDVNVSDGTNSPILIETSELPANAKFEVMKGDLIISKVRPNRGAITVIEANFDDLIVSGAFTVLREKPSSVFTKEVLKVLLRTPIYREWMLQFNVGTQYPVIRDEDILSLPIPKIDLAIQTEISQLVQQSFSLKAQSERLLGVAKRAVEIAIEQDENAALDFIQQHSAPSVH